MTTHSEPITSMLEPGEKKFPPGHPAALIQTARQLRSVVMKMLPVAANSGDMDLLRLLVPLVEQANRDIHAHKRSLFDDAEMGQFQPLGAMLGRQAYREDYERYLRDYLDNAEKALKAMPTPGTDYVLQMTRIVRSVLAEVLLHVPETPVSSEP